MGDDRFTTAGWTYLDAGYGEATGFFTIHIIKIMALTSFGRAEQHMMAYIGVRVELAQVAEAARTIAKLPFVRFAATMLGRFDVLAITIVKDGNELVRLVNDEIMTLPGVRHADTALVVKTLKYDYRWGRILKS